MFISSEYKQWQKCFEQWLMCCNTCSIKVTLSNENIHLNVLVYLWKTRSNPQKIAMLHYSPGYLQQWWKTQLWLNGLSPWNTTLSVTVSSSTWLKFLNILERAFSKGPQHQCCHTRRGGSLCKSESGFLCCLSHRYLCIFTSITLNLIFHSHLATLCLPIDLSSAA